jgi:hypothetical protein
MASQTLKKYMSPKGELQWVTITGEGKENLSGKMQYVASLVLTKEQADTEAATIEAFWQEHRPKKIKVPKSTGLYPQMRKTDQTDEDGEVIKEPTGMYVLAFKTGVSWPDGSPIIVKTHNAKGRAVALGATKIGNGSVGRVSGSYDIYTTKSKNGQIVDAGVTFYLNAIQISKLEVYSEDAGFEVDEDEADGGWTGDDDTFESTVEAEAKPSPRL